MAVVLVAVVVSLELVFRVVLLHAVSTRRRARLRGNRLPARGVREAATAVTVATNLNNRTGSNRRFENPAENYYYDH